MNTDKTFDQMTPEQLEEIVHAELKELAHWYGGWDKIREMIDMLEDNENEAAFERSQNKY